MKFYVINHFNAANYTAALDSLRREWHHIHRVKLSPELYSSEWPGCNQFCAIDVAYVSLTAIWPVTGGSHWIPSERSELERERLSNFPNGGAWIVFTWSVACAPTIRRAMIVFAALLIVYLTVDKWDWTVAIILTAPMRAWLWLLRIVHHERPFSADGLPLSTRREC